MHAIVTIYIFGMYEYIYMLFIQFAIKSSYVIDHNKYIVERIVIVIKQLRISCMCEANVNFC
jgi:hypothetical protein